MSETNDIVKYKINEDVPDECVPAYLTKDKVYDAVDLHGMLIKILEDDEGDCIFIATKWSKVFYPYEGNPLVKVV